MSQDPNKRSGQEEVEQGILHLHDDSGFYSAGGPSPGDRADEDEEEDEDFDPEDGEEGEEEGEEDEEDRKDFDPDDLYDDVEGGSQVGFGD